MCYVIPLHAIGSRLCVVILISICCNFNLFYVSYFNFLCNFFLKFIVHTTRFEMVILIVREKIDMTDADVIIH
jgi:hypothetical protein